MNPKKPGPATVILRSTFDPREYVEKAWPMIKSAPAQALRVALAVIAHSKNSKDGWLLLYYSSIALWDKLPIWKKHWRTLSLSFRLPKDTIRLPLFVSDRAGIAGIWLLLLRRFPDDEVMEEVIRSIVYRLEPSALHSILLAKFLAEKAEKTSGEEQAKIWSKAIDLARRATELESTNAEYQRVHRDLMATAQASKWQEVADEGGDFLGLLASKYQPALDRQKRP